MAINNLAAWKSNFLTQHVQAQNVQGAQFLSSETVVVVSGPPSLTIDKGGHPNGGFSLTDLVPIGLVQNVSVAQQKQLQQVFEVGSKKPYFIPGRTMISAGISRILFDGPSLMYSMYLQKANADGSIIPLDSNLKMIR